MVQENTMTTQNETAKYILSLNTDSNPSCREIYSLALLRVLFEAQNGYYIPCENLTIHIPIALPKDGEYVKNIPRDVLETCDNMHKVMFSGRRSMDRQELSGMIRGQLLTFFSTTGSLKPATTKFIGIEVFSDLVYMERHRYLLEGDYSYDAIDIRSSLESAMEIRHHVGKNKGEVTQEVMKIGAIPNIPQNPASPADPLYGCYECLRIYNGLLKYARGR